MSEITCKRNLLTLVIFLSEVLLLSGCQVDSVANRTTTQKQPFLEQDMVNIQGGCFSMGSPDNEPSRSANENQHQVCVDDFKIGKTEVTRAQFTAFVTETHYQTEAEKGDGCYGLTETGWKQDKQHNWRNLGFEQTDDYPVVCVNWTDVNAYIDWLNRKTGKTYRLPTEAEWEYAARAGSQTSYYWGEAEEQACFYANVADQTAKEKFGWNNAVNCRDGYAFTAPSGKFKPNSLGLYDMMGNVWEWTCSEYETSYAGKEKQCSNNNDPTTPRVLRGGSFDFNRHLVSSAFRYHHLPDSRHNHLGFRVVLSLSPKVFSTQ